MRSVLILPAVLVLGTIAPPCWAQWVPSHVQTIDAGYPRMPGQLLTATAPTGVSSLVAELSLGAAGAIIGAYLGTRIDDSGALSLLTTGTGAIAGAGLGSYATHRKPSVAGMLAGTAGAVVLGFLAGDAGASERSDRAAGWLVFAHLLTVPAAALGSHLRF